LKAGRKITDKVLSHRQRSNGSSRKSPPCVREVVPRESAEQVPEAQFWLGVPHELVRNNSAQLAGVRCSRMPRLKHPDAQFWPLRPDVRRMSSGVGQIMPWLQLFGRQRRIIPPTWGEAGQGRNELLLYVDVWEFRRICSRLPCGSPWRTPKKIANTSKADTLSLKFLKQRIVKSGKRLHPAPLNLPFLD